MTSIGAIPTPDHLYTWVDVDEHFIMLAVHGHWPDWLFEVSAFWDGVEFTVAEGTAETDLWEWLKAALGPLTVDPDGEAILLDAEGAGRSFPVEVRSAVEPAKHLRRPHWAERRVVRQVAERLPQPADEKFRDDVEICAFHSFKGGVGRTLHCLALARELAIRPSRTAGKRNVLLIDADLEAPGITWMLEAQGTRIDFSFEDFLALLHGVTDEDNRREVMALGRRSLLNQQLEGIVVMPARRNRGRFGPPVIEPVDLLTEDRSPYFLTEAIAELAHSVDADTVLIDLRAGASELNSPVLLDARVSRVLVTTMSDQSLQGTRLILREIARRAPSQRPADPPCQVVITQFLEKDHSERVGAAVKDLQDGLAATVAASLGSEGEGEDESTGSVDREIDFEPITSPFDPRLLALPASWIDNAGLLAEVELHSHLIPLVDGLRPLPAPSGSADDAQTSGVLRLQREHLRDVAERLTYAETAAGLERLLPTEPLLNLVSAHRTEAPIEVVVGAKGSGKTFTHLHLCRRQTWLEFASEVGVNDVELAADLVPVLTSTNLGHDVARDVEDVRTAAAHRLTGSSPAALLELRELITTALVEELDEAAWRRIWLTTFARSAGFLATPDDAEMTLTGLARNNHVIFVLDGLEDLFQEFSSDGRQQRALRALLVGCTEWLRSLRGRPLGLIVFIRRDLVFSAIQQNTDQFLARHRQYELRWNRVEALRLVAWVCERAEISAFSGVEGGAREIHESKLSQLLYAVWGQKMGTQKSREARSEEWFLAALSDFRLQVQARDIVSFLSVAARLSAEDGTADTRWPDRLLTPNAMRRALPVCSDERISAISQENPPVGDLFERMRRLPEEAKRVPLDLSTVGLSGIEARLLEVNGVLFREDDQFWMPEIYRHGLGFRGTGRPRVLAMAKLARGRGSAG
ncbi:ParA family protein [Frankia tisae]|uniref:ParA family protein n=1 Tax=Frankia tisae TaxID=2950104 RepID=UPI0021BE98F5|nr:ParA family protein [Frankia tisae]